MKGSGKTTVKALRGIAQAIERPGRVIVVTDHEPGRGDWVGEMLTLMIHQLGLKGLAVTVHRDHAELVCTFTPEVVA